MLAPLASDRHQGLQSPHSPHFLTLSPMLGFKSFHAARRPLVGIELMHMMKKKQGVGAEGNDTPSAPEQFSALAS